MIDTTEAGAGSYPDTPELELICYKVKLVTTNTIECIVYAENEDDAQRLAANGKWDDTESEMMKIEEILNIEKVEN